MAAATNKDSGALFEGLISAEDDSEKLLSAFSTSNIQIVSPTVQGLLSGFKFENDPLGISACDIDYINEIDSQFPGLASLNTDNKESESASQKDFLDSLSSFVDRVKSIRSSFLTISDEIANISDMESYENAFMRMLGMPDDKDVSSFTDITGTEFFDSTKKIVYYNPNINKISLALLSEITGDVSPLSNQLSDQFSNILQERQKVPSSTSNNGRYYDFGNVTLTEAEKQNFIEKAASIAASDGITSNGGLSTTLNFYNPNDLFKFYYLKSVPMQSSKIYGYVSEPSKIVSKPFDPDSLSTVNGIKPKTSLLETIIRVRLDRITGSPGIYSTNEEENNKIGISIGRVKAENLGEDSITQVECFIIQKLKKIMYELSKKYKEDIKSYSEKEIKSKGDEQKPTSNPNTGQAEYPSELQQLEVLKAREDAILFLLKDTSSSYDTSNSSSFYSSLDIQSDIIRTSSGFDDVLSAPLYSILSQRANYLDKKIKQLREQVDATNRKPDDIKKGSGLNENKDNLNMKIVSYIGVCSEDLIVYTMALLSLNQDFLIGLLPQKNRVYLANIISNSILNSKKDPYGIMDRVNKDPAKGGFPSVADSVNALSLLVIKYYGIYVNLATPKDMVDIYKDITNDMRGTP